MGLPRTAMGEEGSEGGRSKGAASETRRAVRVIITVVVVTVGEEITGATGSGSGMVGFMVVSNVVSEGADIITGCGGPGSEGGRTSVVVGSDDGI